MEKYGNMLILLDMKTQTVKFCSSIVTSRVANDVINIVKG